MAVFAGIFLGIINLTGFIIFGVDKKRARTSRYRIPEKTLLLIGLLGGALGSILGMRFFHHKTQKAKFRILEPLFLILWILLIYLMMKH